MSNNKIRSKLPEWKKLDKHAKNISALHIKDLFKENPNRFDDFHIKHEDIMLDYSKQQITDDTRTKLLNLAKACDLEKWRDKLFSGEKINITEERSVLHHALRTQSNDPIIVDGTDIIPPIRQTQERMKDFCAKLRKDKKLTHIVNIGIGGSDLGPSMVYEALKPFSDRDFKLHFVSNIDGTDLSEALRIIDPKKTLFIITSKSFTTQETMVNAKTAKKWLQDKLGKKDISEHFVAVSQNMCAVKKFGILEDHIFPIWDWVGGRYSLWSAIGLSFCIAIGFDNYLKMLKGADSMDKHFRHAPMEENIPILLAMIGVWHRNFLKLPAISITPYDQYLCRLPAYMQQIDMESNGKSIDRQGSKIPYETGPIIIGEAGTNAQHAYFQLLHQGKTTIPCDFIITAKSQNPIEAHHSKLLANAIAQTKALMDGREHDDPQKAFEGNRPSNTIIINELTPYNLGMLLALYEHKIFVQGIIWNINSFDQCGVELGKILANQIIGNFDNKQTDDATDSSTAGILRYLDNL